MDSSIILIWIVVLIVFGLISGAVASSRGHGFLPFFFLGALISPLLAIILCFVISPPRRMKKRGRGGMRRKTKPLYARATRTTASDRNPYKSPTQAYRR